MHEARILRAHDFGQVRKKRDHVVLRLALDLVDPRDVKFHIACLPHRFRVFLRDRAQIGHGDADIGVNKAASAAAAIAALNPGTDVEVVPQRLEEEQLPALLRGVDLVLDATDNYPVRYALNRACIAAALPLVSAAAVRSEGQLSVFDPVRGGPCYRCLYPMEGSDTALRCSESGVLAPVVGVLGSLQALEALKVLSGFGEPLLGKLLLLDLRSMDIRRLALPPRDGCPDCAALR